MSEAFRLTIEDGPTVVVRSFELVERTHFAAQANVVAILTDSDIPTLDLDAVLGSKATLEIAAPGEADPRRFHGLVDAIETATGLVTFTLVSRLTPLGEGRDHRVFVDQDSVAIAKKLLEDAGLSVDVRVQQTPPARLQCVQAFESPLAFVLRILAEDGVTLWVEHGEKEDTVVFGGDGSACADLPGGSTLPYRHGADLVSEESVFELESTSSLSHDGVASGDYDPDHPSLDQNVAVGDDKYVQFVYPGGFRSPDEGRARAQLFLEQAMSRAVVLRARSRCVRLQVGFMVEITDAPNEHQNGRFRILELRQRGEEFGGGERRTRYEAEMLATPEARPMRPARSAPTSLGGLQTMTVTGGGDEVHTDERGCIKAHFRWDRLRPEDDTASRWIRPLQPATSGGFFQPRVGWEVLVGFTAEPIAGGDTPIELGRLIHGQSPPAEGLPAQKVRSNWGTATTPGGGKMNQLRFDDAAGSEGMLLVASADFNERTENDKDSTVTGSETNIVGGDHTFTVTLQQEDAISGSQTYSIAGNRELTTVGVLGLSSAAETVLVAGTRTFDIGGDYSTKCASILRVVGAAENVLAVQESNRHVTGASTIAVGGTFTEIGGITASTGVLGASTLTVTGPMSISANNVSINASALTEKYGGLYDGHAGSKLSITAPAIKLKAGPALDVKGADVFFKATAKIVIKAGGITITMTPASIKVKGKLKGDKTSVVTNKEEVG